MLAIHLSSQAKVPLYNLFQPTLKFLVELSDSKAYFQRYGSSVKQIPWYKHFQSESLAVSRSSKSSGRSSHVAKPEIPGSVDQFPDWNKNWSFFHYTSGRWVFSEAKQLAERHVQFDMNELARVAAASAGSRSCRSVTKYAEGQFNKVFLMTTDKGKELIAKVPHPNAGRPCFTTASEVATMDYVCVSRSLKLLVSILTCTGSKHT